MERLLHSNVGPKSWRSWQSNPVSLESSEDFLQDLFSILPVDIQVGWISSLLVDVRWWVGLTLAGSWAPHSCVLSRLPALWDGGANRKAKVRKLMHEDKDSLISEEEKKEKAPQMMQRQSLTISRLMTSQCLSNSNFRKKISPSFIVEHTIRWHERSLWSVVPASILPTPSLLTWGQSQKQRRPQSCARAVQR